MSEFSIGHLTVKSRWGNAGGVVKTIEDVAAIAETVAGWSELGSITMDPRAGGAVDPEHPELGKTRKVYHYDPVTGLSTNSFRLPNRGLQAAKNDIPEMAEIAHAYGQKLIVNVAPVSDDPVRETQVLVAEVINAGADGVLFNPACPNLSSSEGQREEMLSRNPEKLGRVLEGLKLVLPQNMGVFIRLSPEPTKRKLATTLEVVKNSGVVSAVFTPNSWPVNAGSLLDVPDGIAGRSGPGMLEQALKLTRWTVELLRGSEIDVVHSGSITTPEALKRCMDLGVVAACGSTFYFESEDWEEDTERLLRGHAKLETI